MKKPIISPSILNVNPDNLQAECVELQHCGADWIHCDVMDGIFVPNTSLDSGTVKSINSVVDIPLDVHLMVIHPLEEIERYVSAGADLITFHLESNSDVLATVRAIRQGGAKVGIAIKPGTPVEELIPYAPFVDMILVMTVEPGLGGQKFLTHTLEKIRLARELFPHKRIQVDGGINAETAKLAVAAGADVLVAGSFVIKSENRAESIEKLRNM